MAAEIIAETGYPHAIVAGARLGHPEVATVLRATPPSRRYAASGTPRAAPSPDAVEVGAPGSMGDPAWRRGYALLEQYGLSFDLQTGGTSPRRRSSRATSPGRRSS